MLDQDRILKILGMLWSQMDMKGMFQFVVLRMTSGDFIYRLQKLKHIFRFVFPITGKHRVSALLTLQYSWYIVIRLTKVLF